MQWVEQEDAEKTHAKLMLARQAVAQFPEREACHIALGRALLRTGRRKEAVACLSEALERFPQSVRLRVARAQSRRATDDFEGALADADIALAISPDDRDARQLRERMRLRVSGRKKSARSDRREAHADPHDLHFWSDYAHTHAPDEVCRFCDSKLAENPASSPAIYYKALALAQLGRGDEARAVLSLERLVRIWDLPVPQNYPDAATFLAAAVAEIRNNPTFVSDPRRGTLRKGLRTRKLQMPGARAVEALILGFQDCVNGYERDTAHLNDGYVRARPQRARLKTWALVTHGEGHHIPHVHQDAWLSGVFFVAAPRRKDGNGYDGALILGDVPPHKGISNPPWGIRRIEPVPARIVLFPSYVPHATEPTGTDVERISVAFDVADADMT